MKTYQFKYGKGAVELALDETGVIAELHGNDVSPIADIKEALYASLDAPIEQVPLRAFAHGGDKVALVVSDMSRFWMRQDLVVPHLVRYLNEECCVPDEDIVIVIANGTHLGGSEAELRELVSDAIYDRVRVINHDCLAEDLVYMGTTSRGTRVSINPEVATRKVICLGACTQHVMAGFGGGRKSILPGVSSLEAIRQNHAHSLDPLASRSNPLIGNGVLEHNPLHEDMCEAAAMVPELFIVNLVMNADMKLAALYSGHWLHAWECACRAAQAIYEVPITEQADVLITSAGGFPKDMSLYQGSKTVDNVEPGLKIGGTLILMIECCEGGGAAEYFDWLRPLKAGTLADSLRANFTIPGYIFFLNCEQAQRYNILILSDINPEDVAPMGMRAFRDLDALMQAVDLQGKRVYVIPNGSTVIPKMQELL
ncbi:MAG: nickel-dependent lactate racemase [Pygmaiobacter sp.]